MSSTNGVGEPWRCFCSKRPILGIIGHDAEGTYLHVKVYKQSRIYGEIIAYSGLVRVRCRECLRWHQVRIRKMTADFEQIPS